MRNAIFLFSLFFGVIAAFVCFQIYFERQDRFVRVRLSTRDNYCQLEILPTVPRVAQENLALSKESITRYFLLGGDGMMLIIVISICFLKLVILTIISLGWHMHEMSNVNSKYKHPSNASLLFTFVK